MTNTEPLTGATQEWLLQTGERPSGPPVHIGSPESTRGIAVALDSGKVLVVGPHGTKLAELQLDLPSPTAPLVEELSPGDFAILAADVWGSVYRFNLQGKRLWKYSRTDRVGDGYNFLVLGDVDGNGKKEVLVATERGNLYAINDQGKLRFEVNTSNFRVCTPAVGDINHDSRNEIVFANDHGDVYCINGQGDLLWTTQIFGANFGRSLPLIADPDKNGRYKLYILAPSARSGPGLYVFDALSGKLLWKVNSQLQAYDSIVITDLQGDGVDEILFGDKNTRLYAVGIEGQRLWNTQLDGSGIFFAPAVADLYGDGQATIFQAVRGTGENGKSFYALNGSGKIIDSIPLDHGVPGFHNGHGGLQSPILCRFAGQQNLKLIVVSAAGNLECYRPPQKTGAARILWPGARNDTAFSGFLKSRAKQVQG